MIRINWRVPNRSGRTVMILEILSDRVSYVSPTAGLPHGAWRIDPTDGAVLGKIIPAEKIDFPDTRVPTA
jgi:hypothetical protein